MRKIKEFDFISKSFKEHYEGDIYALFAAYIFEQIRIQKDISFKKISKQTKISTKQNIYLTFRKGKYSMSFLLKILDKLGIKKVTVDLEKIKKELKEKKLIDENCNFLET